MGAGGPLLRAIGGVATRGDAFMLVGSLAGQLLMVLQKVEARPVWIAVNTVGTILYASQGLLLHLVVLRGTRRHSGHRLARLVRYVPTGSP